MRERLVEDWLDKINERGYQSAFCHWLAWRRFVILHNTRHTPIEFGKDVVATDDDGKRVYAFQLKGDPGGRMSFKDWQALLPQIITLVTHLWPGPATAAADEYIPVLVTNGEVDEDARAAIAEFNKGALITGKVRPLQVWARGELLAGFLELSAVSWPTDVLPNKALLGAIASSGTSLPDFAGLDTVLMGEFAGFQKLGKAEFGRRCLSALLVVELFLSTSLRADNHFAVLALRTMARSYIIAAISERPDEETHDGLKQVLSAVRNDVIASIRLLLDEAKEKEKDGVFVQGTPINDFVNFDFRNLLLLSLFAIDGLDRIGREDQETWVLDHILKQKRPLPVWGEACLPQHLAIYWFHRSQSGAMDSDGRLLGLLSWILRAQLSRDTATNLPSTYFDIEQVLERNFREFLNRGQLPIDRDTFYATSTFVVPMTRIAALLNWKQTLKVHWADISRVTYRYTEPSSPANYLRLEDDEATEVHFISPPEKEWSELIKDASDESTPHWVGLLWSDPIMLLLQIVLFPYRSTPEAIRCLDKQLWPKLLQLRFRT